ncbi:MAG: hypothetical protein ACI4OS_02875 [Akkermansia sp.]
MKTRLLLLLLIIAAQVVWLGSQYAARTHERDTAPTAFADCDPFDPRDFLRGHYERINLLSHELPLDSPIIGSSITFDPEFAAQFTPDLRSLRPEPTEDAKQIRSQWEGTRVALFYRCDTDGRLQLTRVEAANSLADRPRKGELRLGGYGTSNFCYEPEKAAPEQGENTLQHKEKGTCTATFHVGMTDALRFYVDEQYADMRRAWKKSHPEEDFPHAQLRVSAELILRPVGKPIVKQLYVNGLPWNEAYRRMERGDFPLTEPAAPNP